MKEVKNKFKTVQMKLFLSLCIVVILIVLFLIIINNVVLESFYLYSKTNDIQEAFNTINQYYIEEKNNTELEEELNKLSAKNDFDILIRDVNNQIIYASQKDLGLSIEKINGMINIDKNNKMPTFEDKNIVIKRNENYTIRKIVDIRSGINFIYLNGTMANNNNIVIRIPITPIQESVRISNNVLFLIGGVSILIAGIMASFLSRRFTKPIKELNNIATNMSKKYNENNSQDEINNLGKSINIMSDKLERTINQLRETNVELEKDIEEKSKIDEMRKQFISDVSHELKTPIALIQGYAEGLVENVNTDEESRKFYAEVILDETNKMDRLVKQLLELMKLEYGKREFNNTKFDIVELVNEVIRKCKVMIEEKQIEVIFDNSKPVYVVADSFYIDQVVTNYFTNAIKHAEEVNGKKQIEITINETKNKKIRVKISNTGENISEENIERIWKRFYKIDSSRNRDEGGTGIGLALVKAIMNNYENGYGVENRENGVEFYFELDKE